MSQDELRVRSCFGWYQGRILSGDGFVSRVPVLATRRVEALSRNFKGEFEAARGRGAWGRVRGQDDSIQGMLRVGRKPRVDSNSLQLIRPLRGGRLLCWLGINGGEKRRGAGILHMRD